MEIDSVEKVVGLATGLTGLGATIYAFVRKPRRSRIIYEWLVANTTDEAGNTHRSIQQISVGTRIPPEEVVAACRHNKKVLQSSERPDLWSVWRKEPQSVYEKRGILSF